MTNSRKMRYYLNRAVSRKFKEMNGIFCNLSEKGDNIIVNLLTRQSLKDSSLELKHRLSETILEYPIEGKSAVIPLKDLFEFDRSVFDVYVKFDSENKMRVKFREKNKFFSAVFENKRKAITSYSTIKNNLSLRFKRIFSYDSIIDSIELKDGKLTMNGLLNLDMHVNNPNVNLEFYLKIINRTNKKEYCKKIESENIEIDLDEFLEAVDYGKYDLFLIYKFNGEVTERRLKFPFKSDENISLNDGRYPLLFFSTLYKNLSFRFDYDYSITDFKVEDGNLIINGEFLNDLEVYGDEDSHFPHFLVEIKNRRSGQRLEKEISEDKVIVPLNELLEIADTGLFDFYFKATNDSTSAKKRIRFNPELKTLKFTLKENKRVLTIYPTLYGRLSLRLKEKNLDMDISSLEEIEGKAFIKGSYTPLNDDIGEVSKATIVGKNRFGNEENEFLLDLKGNEFEGFIDDFDFGDVDLLNLRIDFYLRLYDGDVFYEDLIDLTNLKNFFNDEERFLIKINQGQDIYSYYATENIKSLALWITSEGFYSKSYFTSQGKTAYNDVCSNTPLNKNMIFMESFAGEYYGGNPKYLYEYMLKKGMDKKYSFVWSYSGNEEIPGNPIIVNKESLDYYKYLAEAKYWINNNAFPIKRKRKGNVYLQTWHGTPLKKLGWDVEIPGPEMKGREEFYKESRNWDYLISSNEYSTEKFGSAFKFEEETLELGYPINDIYFNNNSKEIEELKNKFNIPHDKKVILYAPTWKDDERSKDNVRYFNLDIDLEKLYDKLKDDYVIILKTHYFVSKSLKIDERLNDFVIDLSFYDDVCQLCLISDILITDYSSVFFDYAHSRRPILFFVPDLEHYVSEVRGLYLNMETDMPGPLIKDNDYLIECIENIDAVEKEYKERYDKFYEKFCSICKGHSSEEIIKRVFELEDGLEEQD